MLAKGQSKALALFGNCQPRFAPWLERSLSQYDKLKLFEQTLSKTDGWACEVTFERNIGLVIARLLAEEKLTNSILSPKK